MIKFMGNRSAIVSNNQTKITLPIRLVEKMQIKSKEDLTILYNEATNEIIIKKKESVE